MIEQSRIRGQRANYPRSPPDSDLQSLPKLTSIVASIDHTKLVRVYIHFLIPLVPYKMQSKLYELKWDLKKP